MGGLINYFGQTENTQVYNVHNENLLPKKSAPPVYK